MRLLSVFLWGRFILILIGGCCLRLSAAVQCVGATEPCMNNATCVLNSTDKSGMEYCSCPIGFSGEFCQFSDPCWSEKCHNGGTCVLTNLTEFRCDCPPGFTGKTCESSTDDCIARGCQNGGTCINTNGVYRCSSNSSNCGGVPCEVATLSGRMGISGCPNGKIGIYCRLENPCLKKPCHNNAECEANPINGSYRCICPAGFIGELCDQDIDECSLGEESCSHWANQVRLQLSPLSPKPHPAPACDSSPCLNGAECLNDRNQYTCLCKSGFTGVHCEKVDVCANSPCLNGGHCLAQGKSFVCSCHSGFSGLHCEQLNECEPNPCGPGTCKEQLSGFTCECPPGLAGRTCDDPSPVDPCLSHPCNNGATCSSNTSAAQDYTCTCLPLAGDTSCHPACNRAECAWDGGDCSLGWRPWRDCPPEHRCWKLFRNGRCDPLCDVAECLFDGFECRPTSSSCKYEPYCTEHFANGQCNQDCDTQECGWDGLDCADGGSSQLAGGWLVLVVQLAPEVVLRELRGLLRELAMLLRTNVRVRRDEQNRPMIYRYYGPQEGDARVRRGLKNEAVWSKVFLEIDNRRCSAQNHGSCFLTAEQAASFIAARYQDRPLSFPLLSVEGLPQEPTSQVQLLYLVAIVVLVVLLVLGALAVKRRRKHGALWLPDGFLFKGRRRREPIGQDDLDLKDIMKPKEGVKGVTAEDQLWLGDGLQHQKSKTDDSSLLPTGTNNVAAGHDPRHWTPQHWKAAQAEMDVNCLDVNVRGPDGMTPLMLASLRHSPECKSPLGAELEEEGAAPEAGPDIIMDLVALGAMLQARTEATGETALHLAARFSRADATKRLLDAGADANARDHAGRTPLHTAVAADAQGVFQILIRNRATDLNARMKDGTTATILATRLAVEGMVQQLVHCHADVNAVDDHGGSRPAATVGRLKKAFAACWEMEFCDEETPLFLAAREGSFDVARILLDHCCSREIADHLDRLPRDIAQERMHHDIVQLLDHYNLVPSPHVGHDGLPAALPHAPLGCSKAFPGSHPGPQAKKGRRGAGARQVPVPLGKEVKDPKAKRRKKVDGVAPGGGAGADGVPAGGGLSGEGSGTLSPPDSLESPHTFTGDAAATSRSVTSPLLMVTPTINRPLLPPVSQMLPRQQQACWREGAPHRYKTPSARLLPQQFGASQPAAPHHYQMSRMACDPLSSALAFQMMAQRVDVGQDEVLFQPQQGATLPPCVSTRTFLQSTAGGISESHLMYSHGPGGTSLCPSVHRHDRSVDKDPDPYCQHSYISGRLEGTTPCVRPCHPVEHPYLTPSPESLDPWSCSSSPSSHSNSDWSEVTVSPTSVPACHTLVPHLPHPKQTPHSSMQVLP
ncbi:hypothetical protein GN956_G25171 [Arapaima gigas]